MKIEIFATQTERKMQKEKDDGCKKVSSNRYINMCAQYKHFINNKYTSALYEKKKKNRTFAFLFCIRKSCTYIKENKLRKFV